MSGESPCGAGFYPVCVTGASSLLVPQASVALLDVVSIAVPVPPTYTRTDTDATLLRSRTRCATAAVPHLGLLPHRRSSVRSLRSLSPIRESREPAGPVRTEEPGPAVVRVIADDHDTDQLARRSIRRRERLMGDLFHGAVQFKATLASALRVRPQRVRLIRRAPHMLPSTIGVFLPPGHRTQRLVLALPTDHHHARGSSSPQKGTFCVHAVHRSNYPFPQPCHESFGHPPTS